jgi:hypothetical protein
MKKILSIVFLMVLTCGVQASADTFSQQLVAAAKKISDKITASKLNTSLKSDFTRQLSTIMSDAGCRTGSGMPGPDPCANATPSAIQQAEGKLNKLSDAVDQAIKDDASKSMLQIYQQRIDALRRNIETAKVDPADKQKLERRLMDFQALLNGKSAGRPLSPEDADKTLKAIADDLAAAIDLNQKTGTIAAGFLTKVDALKKKIEGTKLNAQFKNDFLGQLSTILSHVCSNGMSSGAKAGPTSCSNATPSAIANAEGELAKLEAAVDKAVQDDGGKDMSQIYKPQIEALITKLARSKVDPNDAQKLRRRIDEFAMLTTGKGGTGTGSGRPGGPVTPEMLQKTFQQLSDDVDAAILLAENSKSKTFADDFMRKAGDLNKKIGASKLNDSLKHDFNNQLNNIVNQAGCGAGASTGRETSCARATPSTISRAESDLAKLSDDVDKAIKADTGKSMYDIYRSQLEALNAKLARAKIDTSDKQRLQRRLDDLTQSLRSGGAGAGKAVGSGRGQFSTPDDVDRAIKQLSDDIDAATAMSATKH